MLNRQVHVNARGGLSSPQLAELHDVLAQAAEHKRFAPEPAAGVCAGLAASGHAATHAADGHAEHRQGQRAAAVSRVPLYVRLTWWIVALRVIATVWEIRQY
jgi:hypothetical protein